VRADELVEGRWYRVKVTHPGGLVLGAPRIRGPVPLAEGQEVTLVWCGVGTGGRWRRSRTTKGARWVPSAGTFWDRYDVGTALVLYFEDVEVLGEVPATLDRDRR
jgi:hypothetical protein